MRSRSTALLIGLAALAAGLVATPAEAASTTYYVDCSAAAGGTGSSSSPFNSLTSVNALTLTAGDQVLLQRGTACSGQLAPKATGTAAAPVVIGAYGSGDRPAINADGATNAVLLDNTPYTTVQDLELTADGDNTAYRRGVYVYAADAGVVSGITLRRLDIHDVRGVLPTTVSGNYHGTGKYANATGGIVIEAQGTTTPTAFANTSILDNEIHSVDREGIYTWSNWCKRTQLAAFWQDSLCFADWKASTGLVVRGNDLRDIGGDGIVAKGQDGALVEHNQVTGFNERAGSVNIGIWTANSDNGLFQYNEVSGGNTTSDGQSYDVDHSTKGTVFQYNLSHDNDGGFFLLCPYDTPVADFVIRDNISINDRTRTFQVCSGQIDNGQIYNNTISVGSGLSPVFLTESTSAALDLAFTDNLVRKTGSGSVSWNFSDSHVTFDHNAFYGVTAPTGATNTVTTAPGLVAPGTRDPHGYRLITGYGTLGTGAVVSGNGGLDYYGNTVSATAAPNIGAYNGAGTTTPVLTDLFDTLSSSWTVTGTASATADPSGDLGNSAKITGTSALTRAVGGTTTRRVSALVRSDSASAPVVVEVLDSAGTVVATAAQSDTTAGEWHRVELSAPSTATTVRVRATSSGASYVDDVIVQPVG
ncbi:MULTISPECIES: right-handed parallel beta-helix repeat-containing protein [unclassified Streptomyces]|uniref:right-handed parallel beta-helix repeat-containing protein n=1 Tax=unclassified Streptomyces TaxID=2593676 RepID=UPI002E81E52D|nr:right-handed parallel beta-helix repeat-containing protein [Streptomyces sp. NBC_00589]WTI35323.1 right-handed parallel beta-helix repeat-containing protein [Streptomyces sp. NBC_00775]WUB31003.1 right-handed parallel beta-helix repeat-containing protein [Streptomyces sp. NBC_00589]